MILSRVALRRENRTLRAQLQAAHNSITDLQAQLDRSPALVENIRLAHQLEQAEARIAELQAAGATDRAKLRRFLTQHPHLFDREER